MYKKWWHFEKLSHHWKTILVSSKKPTYCNRAVKNQALINTWYQHYALLISVQNMQTGKNLENWTEWNYFKLKINARLTICKSLMVWCSCTKREIVLVRLHILNKIWFKKWIVRNCNLSQLLQILCTDWNQLFEVIERSQDNTFRAKSWTLIHELCWCSLSFWSEYRFYKRAWFCRQLANQGLFLPQSLTRQRKVPLKLNFLVEPNVAHCDKANV